MNWEKFARVRQAGPITGFGWAVTVAGFALAAIVWINAGEIAGHTVSLRIPLTDVRFSVALLLPVLSEGFVYMAVRIHDAIETSPETKRFAFGCFVGALVIMSLVGLIVNTPLAEHWLARAVVSAIIGALTPVALLLAWSVRSRYAADVQRYRERLAEEMNTPKGKRSRKPVNGSNKGAAQRSRKDVNTGVHESEKPADQPEHPVNTGVHDAASTAPVWTDEQEDELRRMLTNEDGSAPVNVQPSVQQTAHEAPVNAPKRVRKSFEVALTEARERYADVQQLPSQRAMADELDVSTGTANKIANALNAEREETN